MYKSCFCRFFRICLYKVQIGLEQIRLSREPAKAIIQTHNIVVCHAIWLYNYGHISHQVDSGFELLARSQGMETTLGLYQVHARDILHGMKVGVTTHMSPLQYCTRRRDP